MPYRQTGADSSSAISEYYVGLSTCVYLNCTVRMLTLRSGRQSNFDVNGTILEYELRPEQSEEVTVAMCGMNQGMLLSAHTSNQCSMLHTVKDRKC
jgi:hypothetical protein